MNKKQPQPNPNKNLLQQFYSHLNISWSLHPESATKNPILYRTEHNLISKSLAHKFFNSKRYKLNQSRKGVRKEKESGHVFTSEGIVNVQAHRRRMSEPAISVSIKGATKQNVGCLVKFTKYENSPLCQISKHSKFSKTCNLNSEGVKVFSPNQQKQKQKILTNRSIRAMSAHLSSRRTKTSGQDNNSFRKTSQNWTWVKREPRKKEEKNQVKGWDTEPDHVDLHVIDLKVCLTQF